MMHHIVVALESNRSGNAKLERRRRQRAMDLEHETRKLEAEAKRIELETAETEVPDREKEMRI